MPHIHTEPGQIDHTVTAYIIRTDGSEPQALLHMHKKLDKLLPVGGHIELDETPWAALAHELEEESGYKLSDLMVMQPRTRIESCADVVVHPQPVFVNTHAITPDHYHSDMAYLLMSTAGPLGKISDDESTDLRWLTRQQIVDLPIETIWDNTRQVYLNVFDVFINEWEAVPADSYGLKPSL